MRENKKLILLDQPSLLYLSNLILDEEESGREAHKVIVTALILKIYLPILDLILGEFSA